MGDEIREGAKEGGEGELREGGRECKSALTTSFGIFPKGGREGGREGGDVAHTYLPDAQRVSDCGGDLVKNGIQLHAMPTPT